MAEIIDTSYQMQTSPIGEDDWTVYTNHDSLEQAEMTASAFQFKDEYKWRIVKLVTTEEVVAVQGADNG